MLKHIAKASVIGRVTRRIDTVLGSTREFGDLKALEAIPERIVGLVDERGFTDEQRYELFYQIGRQLLPGFSISDHGRYFLKDAAFRSYFERFIGTSGNWKNYERRWTVWQLLRLVPDVPGDLAECGVFEGATSYPLCEFARDHDRRVHLFDSFEGISEPNENDGVHWEKGELSASEAVVRANLQEFDCFDTYPGWIPDRFPDVADKPFAFVHIDVDLERPTFDSIAFFYPRMSAGGLIILDDHGFECCPGARKAVLDYMADKREPVLDLATGQGLIVKAAPR